MPTKEDTDARQEQETVITEPRDRLMQIKFPSGGQDNYHFGGGAGEVRELLRKLFRLNAEYIFFRTRANPQALRLIEEYEDELAVALKTDRTEFRPRFGADLMDVYLRAVTEVASARGLPVISYPLVRVHAHNLERHTEQPSWPVIHVVRDAPPKRANAIGFARLINFDLNGSEIFDAIQRIEAPQNYRLPYVELIRRERVLPLVQDIRLVVMSGRTLRDAIDFLDQFHFSAGYSESCGWNCED